MTNLHPHDAPIPPGEEWYYELDGRTHGPHSKPELDQLLNSAGEAAAGVRIRQGTNGAWNAFQPGSAVGSYPAAVRASQDSGIQGDTRPLSGRIGRKRTGRPIWQQDIAIACAALLLFNAFFLVLWPQPYTRERRYLEELETICAEVQEMRAKPASDAEWEEFGRRIKANLAPMIRDLKKKASAAEPVRQRLLWSARDLIPKTFGPHTKERDELENRLKQYLASSRRDIERPAGEN